MKKLLTLALLGLAALGLGVGQASAGHCFTCFPFSCFHHHCGCCCKNICCTQYNAFSPCCCDGPCGAPAPQGWANPCPPGGEQACQAGDGCCLGELPAPGSVGGTVMNAPITTPGSGTSLPSGTFVSPGTPILNGVTVSPSTPMMMPGSTPQLVPTPMPNMMMSPMGAPSYSPIMTSGPVSTGR